MRRKLFTIGALISAMVLGGCGGPVQQEILLDPGASQTVEINVEMKSETTETQEKPEESVVTSPEEQTETDKENYYLKFLQKLKEETGTRPEDIVYSVVDTFEGTEDFSGFFFVGSYWDGDYPNTYDGTMYLVNEKGVRPVEAESTYWDVTKVYTFGDKKYLELAHYYATDSVSYLYGLKEGELNLLPISGIGTLYCPENIRDGDTFSITFGSYDIFMDVENEMYSGHSWKPYYFRYNASTDEIEEIKGKEIDRSLLTARVGFDLCEEIQAIGGTVLEIYDRDNGIVTVNYCIANEETVTYGNANWDCKAGRYVPVWDENENSLGNSDYEGRYQSSVLDYLRK